MNTRRSLMVLLAVAMASFPAVVAHAQGREGGPRLERMAKELDLTDAQRAKMREAGERQMRRGIQERADLKIAALDLHKLMRADKPSQQAIDAQVDKIAGMRAQLQKERIATMLEMRSMLTAEQRAKAETMREARGGSNRMRGIHKIDGRPGLHMQHEHSDAIPMPDGGGPPVDS